MKTYPSTNFITHSSCALAFALTLACASPAGAQPAEPGAMMMQGKMKMDHQTMMADMKAQNEALTAQVAEMNSAPADKKLDLLAALVTKLVEQRTAMGARMEKMQSEMMKDRGEKSEPSETSKE